MSGLVLALVAGCRDDDGEAINPRTEQAPATASPEPTPAPSAGPTESPAPSASPAASVTVTP